MMMTIMMIIVFSMMIFFVVVIDQDCGLVVMGFGQNYLEKCMSWLVYWPICDRKQMIALFWFQTILRCVKQWTVNLCSQSSNIVDLASFPLFIYLFDDTLKILECKKKKSKQRKRKKELQDAEHKMFSKEQKGRYIIVINGILSKQFTTQSVIFILSSNQTFKNSYLLLDACTDTLISLFPYNLMVFSTGYINMQLWVLVIQIGQDITIQYSKSETKQGN